MSEIEVFLQVIQGQLLSIGDLERALAGSLNRNQIKYLIQKLCDDEVIVSVGSGRGTKYRIADSYSLVKGDALINEVQNILREKHDGISHDGFS